MNTLYVVVLGENMVLFSSSIQPPGNLAGKRNIMAAINPVRSVDRDPKQGLLEINIWYFPRP